MFYPLTPLRFLTRAVDLYGHKIGVISGEKQFTYTQFGERCQRLAAALRKFRLNSGDRVAFLSFNNHQLLEGYYGVIQARGIVMPLNVRLTAEELAAIVEHAQARYLFFEKDFAEVAEHLRQECASLEYVASLDEPGAPADYLYEEMLAEVEPAPTDPVVFDENAVAELFYTSGSTGTPKGVMLTHRTLYLHALYAALSLTPMGYDDTAVDLHTIPLYHANGWGRPQTAPMMGATQVMVRRFDPAQVLQMIEHYRATHMCLVPTMANAILNCPDLSERDLSSLRMIMLGGAASSPTLIERLETRLKCRAIAGYGLTETSPVATFSGPKSTLPRESDEQRWRRQAMTGLAIPNVELRVVDPAMRDVPRDMSTMGEIIVRSDSVMDGYYDDEDGTSAVMEDGWLHTGDMAVWDEESYVLILDRKKEIIISGGENISSLEIEKAIVSHPEVYECAVVAAPDDTWGETPAAIIYAQPGSSLTPEGMQQYLEGKLGRFKIPKLYQFVDEPLPKGGTGKVKKLTLKEQFWQGKEKRVQG